MGKIDDTILGKIFWLRNEDLDNREEYYKMREKYEKKVNVNLAEKSIIKFFNENVKNEYKREEFKKLLVKYSDNLLSEMSFEDLFFYKIGFKDGCKFYCELNDLNDIKIDDKL